MSFEADRKRILEWAIREGIPDIKLSEDEEEEIWRRLKDLLLRYPFEHYQIKLLEMVRRTYADVVREKRESEGVEIKCPLCGQRERIES